MFVKALEFRHVVGVGDLEASEPGPGGKVGDGVVVFVFVVSTMGFVCASTY